MKFTVELLEQLLHGHPCVGFGQREGCCRLKDGSGWRGGVPLTERYKRN